MGIPKWFNDIVRGKNYPRVTMNGWGLPSGSVSTLSIDFNALIYTALGPIFKTGDFKTTDSSEILMRANFREKSDEAFRLIFQLILQIVRNFAPTDAVVIAVDGPPPIAKMLQQKKRRYLSSMHLDRDSTIDTNALSPGTDFMNRLDTFLRENISESYAEFGAAKILYSPHTVVGEAEHKIYDYFRKGVIGGPNHHVIYGVDADLFILSLLSRIPRLVVARDSVPLEYRNAAGTVIPLRMTRQRNMNYETEFTNVFIDELRKAMSEGLSDSAPGDIALTTSLIGNDFIPQTYCMMNVGKADEEIVKALREYGQPLTAIVDEKSVVDWEGFFKILAILSAAEARLVRDRALDQLASIYVKLLDKFEVIRILRKEQRLRAHAILKELISLVPLGGIESGTNGEYRDGALREMRNRLYSEIPEIVNTTSDPVGEIVRFLDGKDAMGRYFIDHRPDMALLQKRIREKINFLRRPLTGSIEEGYEVFREYWYSKALGPHRLDAIQALGFIQKYPITQPEDIADMCYQYLRGIAWTFSYYSNGQDSMTWSWYYPYGFAPLLRDVYVTLGNIIRTGDPSVFNVTAPAGEIRMGVPHQLAAIMPPNSLPHVPFNLHPLWSENSPISDLMPSTIIFDTIFHDLPIDETEVHGDILLPCCNYERIMNAVVDLCLSQNDPILRKDLDWSLEIPLDQVLAYRQSEETKFRLTAEQTRRLRGERGGRGGFSTPRGDSSAATSSSSVPHRGGRGDFSSPRGGNRGNFSSPRGRGDFSAPRGGGYNALPKASLF